MKKLPSRPPSSEVTPEALYRGRRDFLKNAALTAGTAALVSSGLTWLVGAGPGADPVAAGPAPAAAPAQQGASAADEGLTPLQSVTTYNNFYEFGTDMGDPARNAHTLVTRPWTISIEGEVARPQTVDIETLLNWFTPEERVYASIGCAASRAGRWSSPGSASRSPT